MEHDPFTGFSQLQTSIYYSLGIFQLAMLHYQRVDMGVKTLSQIIGDDASSMIFAKKNPGFS